VCTHEQFVQPDGEIVLGLPTAGRTTQYTYMSLIAFVSFGHRARVCCNV
jgi:hypothetical protein